MWKEDRSQEFLTSDVQKYQGVKIKKHTFLLANGVKAKNLHYQPLVKSGINKTF